MAKENKKYVRIASSINIGVTAGLQHKDLTLTNGAKDALKIGSLWNKLVVDIIKGSHYYPAQIVEWHSVKVLAEKRLLTIGEFVDEPDEAPQMTEKEYAAKSAVVFEDKSLDKLAEEK